MASGGFLHELDPKDGDGRTDREARKSDIIMKQHDTCRKLETVQYGVSER